MWGESGESLAPLSSSSSPPSPSSEGRSSLSFSTDNFFKRTVLLQHNQYWWLVLFANINQKSLPVLREGFSLVFKSRLLDANKVILRDWVQYIGLVHRSNHQIRFLVVHHSSLLVRLGFLVLALIVMQSF